MTRKEAIKNIKEHCYFASLLPQAKEALDVAIKALEQESCEDAISRQAVIDLVVANHTELNGVMVVMYSPLCKDIKQLPPVNPQESMCESTEEEAKAYSKAFDKMYKPSGFNVFNESCDDVISRQAVLDALSNLNAISFYEAQEDSKETYYEIRNAIKALLSVNLQPKTGHWIDDNENEIDAQYGRHLYKCSECNEYADMFVGGTEDWWDLEKPNYCPNCGARMEESEEKNDKKRYKQDSIRIL